jgi:hypothetical protein
VWEPGVVQLVAAKAGMRLEVRNALMGISGEKRLKFLGRIKN